MSKKSDKIHEGVAPDHYDKAISTNLLQKIWHKTRFMALSGFLEPVDGKILDIGCHSGLCTEEIIAKTSPLEVHGIDLSVKAIEKARRRIKNGKFLVGDAENLPYQRDFFDGVFCIEMLEHVDRPDKVLAQIQKILKKGKYAVIMVPTDNLLFQTIWFIWNLRHPVWKHVHVQSFKGDTLEKLSEELGFKVDKVKKFNLGMLKIVKLIKV